VSGYLAGKVWHSGLDPRLKPLAAALADIADHDGTSLYPSIEYLAWLVGTSDRTVQRQLRDLIQSGVVALLRPGGGRGNLPEYALHETALPKRSPFKKGVNSSSFPSTSKGDSRRAKKVTVPARKGDSHDQLEAPVLFSDPSVDPLERSPTPAARQDPQAVTQVAAPEWLSQLWNEKAGNVVPKVLSISKTRQRLAHGAWLVHPEPAWWRTTLDRAHRSRFLRGAKGWKMNFDWFVKGDNALRVTEGVHDNHEGDFRAEYEKAQMIINRDGGRCSHDPMCADREEHLERVVDRILGLSSATVE